MAICYLQYRKMLCKIRCNIIIIFIMDIGVLLQSYKRTLCLNAVKNEIRVVNVSHSTIGSMNAFTILLYIKCFKNICKCVTTCVLILFTSGVKEGWWSLCITYISQKFNIKVVVPVTLKKHKLYCQVLSELKSPT
jgi:hypothetical protein